MQVAVLVGGLGTRLRGAIPEGTPKPMAEVAGRPFLEHVLSGAAEAGATDFLLLTGHRSEVIRSHFGAAFAGIPIRYSVEAEPRGTGGALLEAADLLAEVFVLINGDTWVEADLDSLVELASPLSMALVEVSDTARYGRIDTEDGVVIAMREKGVAGPGLINAGAYGIRKDLLGAFPDRPVVSLEQDVLVPRLSDLAPRYVLAGGAFYDIGIPADYRAADAWFSAGAAD